MRKILIIMLSLRCACAVSRVSKNTEVSKPTENSFLYLTYRISRDTVTQETRIELKNKSEIAGSVKSTNESYTNPLPHFCTMGLAVSHLQCSKIQRILNRKPMRNDN